MTHNKNVISFPGGSQPWRFFDFVYPSGTNPMEVWYRRLAEEARYMFDNILKDNSKIENPRFWADCRKLGGRYTDYGLWEFRFQCVVQYRVIGRFGPRNRCATLLGGCYHKDKVYNPPDALDTAYRRAGMLCREEANLVERPVRMDR